MAAFDTSTQHGPINLLKGNGSVPGYDKVVTGPESTQPGRIQVDKAAAEPDTSKWQ